MSLYVGLMSGTSMDGIDAALLDLPSNQLIHGITKQYSNDVRKNLDDLIVGKYLTLASICQLNTLIGREFAEAVRQLLIEIQVHPKEIQAIGSHGQTVCHDTSGNIPYTLQLGCGHTISSLTGITVVADFRTRDLVNGGQGAPFAPLYHQQIFSRVNEPVAIVNIGGIANVTFIAKNQMTRGWDIGPGNCLMDAWIYKNKGALFDKSGVWASQGEVIRPLLEHLLQDPFFHLDSPKSIGKEYFSLSWLQKHLKPDYTPANIQATLLALTAHTIAETILNTSNEVKQLYLCGGGAHNTHLKETLASLLPGMTVKSIAELGFSPDYLEAMMFAWLAAQTINQIPVDLTSITGAKGIAILGAVYPIIKSY
ncbi:TPA: anhydro-N-acetylmuramic acid kinase [Legionella pneumophila]|uniref:anhydro-N-acetylmuramic acid kinase n=1 Tax=Legionella pneumophila TaxID=446 RepID=UPI000788CA9F|nr:anhydro-N-acetylmuramic acid kinase [Legionella pneumophila]MDW8878854.1 anhydro-N-acetylmuramic acid kinase [Legionella pneumophila subsp. fraseri]MDW8961332.1 anhydro-N-acetylmuramic acid kinase [Legionella pneumophila subsp. fraseri]MDW9037100.1 anhydro-N-acetylmuramic acid kinase [Legionella pneumophila subsp. fraseri]MDW9038852.1 anhydro-N-acetylmuramic acid kinase [Legionella pneumophila subsp. fraseri]MDW9041700.1 anhydro-N-acetylmuramic acid kinase [Legionella pneumophila subsp. fra